MKCPRCENVILEEKDRGSLTIDVCTTCRGVWLDRGELEKLVAMATREVEEVRGAAAPAQTAAPREAPYAGPPRAERWDEDSSGEHRFDGRYRKDGREPGPSERGSDGYGRPRKKEGFFSRLGDVFDF